MNETPNAAFIFKLLRGAEAAVLVQDLVFKGSPADVADGYIHLSTAAQVPGTAAKHFAGDSGLWVAAVETARVAGELRWEPSRGGQLFPHLYAPLTADAVAWLRRAPLGADGVHRFPAEMA